MRYALTLKYSPNGNDWFVGHDSNPHVLQPYFITDDVRFVPRFWTRNGVEAYRDRVEKSGFLTIGVQRSAVMAVKKLTKF